MFNVEKSVCADIFYVMNEHNLVLPINFLCHSIFIPHTTAVTKSSCHVIVRNCLSLSMGSRGVAAGANPSLVSGRGQGTPWTSRQLTDEQWGGSVSCSKTLRHAAQPCPEPGFELATF